MFLVQLEPEDILQMLISGTRLQGNRLLKLINVFMEYI